MQETKKRKHHTKDIVDKKIHIPKLLLISTFSIGGLPVTAPYNGTRAKPHFHAGAANNAKYKKNNDKYTTKKKTHKNIPHNTKTTS